MLTFPMSKNAKQDILSPYFQCKMDEIDEIGHSDANSSLLHQPCMVKSYFDAYFVCSHFGSQILGHQITDFLSSLARIDHVRTTLALYGKKINTGECTPNDHSTPNDQNQYWVKIFPAVEVTSIWV